MLGRDGFSVPAAQGETPAPPRLAAGLAGALFLIGALVTAGAVLLPHTVDVDTTGYWLLCGAQLAFGLVMAGSSRFGGGSQVWLTSLVIIGGIVTISLAIYLTSKDTTTAPPLAIFYVWPAMFAGYFFRPALTAATVVGIGIAQTTAASAAGVSANPLLLRVTLTLSAVAGTAAAARALRIYVDGLVARLDKLARVDALTALVNRRGFDEQLAHELARAARRGETLALAIGDIDGFKALNDRFGHAEGDRALAAVGRALGQAARASDITARIGGEEFALLMPGTDPAEAVIATERLRKAIAMVRTPAGNPIAISFGLATTADSDCRTADDLLVAADRALYLGKARGGNCTLLYEPGMTRPDPHSGSPASV